MAKPRGSICLEVTSVEIHITHIKIITCNALHLKIYQLLVFLELCNLRYTSIQPCMHVCISRIRICH